MAKIEIERAYSQMRVKLHTSRPGIVIGRKGAEIENLSNKISAMCDGQDVKIDIHEIKENLLITFNILSTQLMEVYCKHFF